MTLDNIPPFAQPPAHVVRYVETLGVDQAVEFLLKFGGAELYLSRNPTARSELVKAFGIDAARKLGEAADEYDLPARVPTAKKWVALVLWSQGLTGAEIARRLHMSDTTVRSWINAAKDKIDPRQADLF
tara:strand:- start:4596 stop:4982 length:387 start_codon:yes stop_codon:yes gene_type:complete